MSIGHGAAPVRVAVIGGGVCGAFFAAQLARLARVPTRISVVEPRAVLGTGLAYSTTDPAHRINVPAARMSLFPETPADFDIWLRRGGELEADPEARWMDGSLYPRRAAFGRYMAEIVAAQANASAAARIEHIRDRAVSARRCHDGYVIELGQGATLAANILVLATSHPPPKTPPLLAALGDDPHLTTNPWADDALSRIPADADVLIVGLGLTMADVVATLARNSHRGHITAFSRRGLLPRGHAGFTPLQPFTWFGEHAASPTILGLLREVRALIARAAEDGIPWQSVFDDIRANGQKIWRSLDAAERSRFLRHLRVYWDAHRYRIAPQIDAVLDRKRHDGSLEVLAASLQGVRRHSEKIEVTLKVRRPCTRGAIKIVDHVIVTTGPAHGTIVQQVPVLGALAEQGLLRPDPLGLGLQVDSLGRAIQRDGAVTPGLLVVGPLAREQYGELMGMPQVAGQSTAVATHVAETINAGAAWTIPAVIRTA